MSIMDLFASTPERYCTGGRPLVGVRTSWHDEKNITDDVQWCAHCGSVRTKKEDGTWSRWRWNRVSRSKRDGT